MNLSEQHRNLIENIIKQNPMYLGHEYLMDKFCAEVYKKSYLLLDSVSNVDSLKNYLAKVAQTSVANVIKNSAQDKNQTSVEISDIQSVCEEKNIQFSPEKKLDIAIQKRVLADSVTKDTGKDSPDKNYAALIDPAEFFPYKPTTHNISEEIIKALTKIDSKNPEKKYLEIFKMRHIQNFRQSVIARNLRLSQAELSKRYCEMVKLIKNELG